MSGQKGMKHFGASIIQEVLYLRSQGKTHQEIADFFQLRNKDATKGLIKRYKRQEEKRSQGILPKKKGRPSEHKKVETLENKVLRLERENDLLRSFLQKAGRS